MDQQACAVLAQSTVDGKTNEITAFGPLLEPLDLTGRVDTADALHTQRSHAEFLAGQKNAHYICAVKKDQPGLHAQLKRLPWRQVPAGYAERGRGHGHGREERRTLKAVTVAAGLAFPTPPRPPPSPAPWPAGNGGPSPPTHHQPDHHPGHPAQLAA